MNAQEASKISVAARATQDDTYQRIQNLILKNAKHGLRQISYQDEISTPVRDLLSSEGYNLIPSSSGWTIFW